MGNSGIKGCYVYIGTYSRNGSEGVYVYRMDPDTGAWTSLGVGAVGDNPSFVALHPTGRFLYTVNEVNSFRGQESGGVTAFAIDPGTGGLTLLNQQASVGTGPCHIDVDATGKYALVANYAGGSVAMLPIGTDGKLGVASDFHQHVGSSITPRQNMPHAHSINVDPTNKYAFVPDLGQDKVVIYRLDLERGKLLPNEAQAYVRVAPGGGPRHFCFHPNGRYAYVINEIGNTITVFSYDASRGVLGEIQHIGTLPEGFDGRSHTADIHFHPSGRFLYGSNRGHDSIAIFAVDAGAGKLTPIAHESTRGEIPRNFGLDPTGRFLYVANQNSDNVVAFRIDQETDRLTPTGDEIKVPVPVCIKMLPIT